MIFVSILKEFFFFVALFVTRQLIAWSEKTDETETLISMLDEVDQELRVMEVHVTVAS